MSLADAIQREKQPPGPKCAVAYALRDLDADDAATLTAAMADTETKSSAIYRALRSIGYQGVSAFSLNRHRKGDCSCG